MTVCNPLPSNLIFDAASRGARVHRRVVCWTIPAIAPHASHITWVRGATRTGMSTILRHAATAVATNPQTITARATSRVDVVVPPQCVTSSLQHRTVGSSLAVIAC